LKRASDYLAYHKSLTAEFQAVQNRVRYFIDNAHWGEDGRFKEILLINHLKKVLPSNVSVGTGFVRKGEELTSQIDIIIFNNSIPTLFSEGDFVIVIPESVLGIIEVKSTLSSNEMFIKAVQTATDNGKIIGFDIFNGIFGYESKIKLSPGNNLGERIKQEISKSSGFLNHISFGSKFFMKHWKDGNPKTNSNCSTYSFYKLNDLAYGYFISNLVYFIHKSSGTWKLSNDFENFLFPIENGKENYRLNHLEIPLPRKEESSS
jgi:hypothetical protein